MGDLTSLRCLHLQKPGKILQNFGNLMNLFEADLSRNALSGPSPAQLVK